MGTKKVGIVCCSNGQKNTYKDRIQQLRNILSNKEQKFELVDSELTLTVEE